MRETEAQSQTTPSATFLAEIAPVLPINPQELIVADSDILHEQYSLLIDGLDNLRPKFAEAADQRLISLIQVVLEARQYAQPLEEALEERHYIFDPADLPFVTRYLASWLCDNLTIRNHQGEVASDAAPLMAAVAPTTLPDPLPAAELVIEAEPTFEDIIAVKTGATERSLPDAENHPETPEEMTEEEFWEQAAQVDKVDGTVDTDTVRVYIKGIGKVALLNAEGEVELAKQIEAGIFAEEKLAVEGNQLKLQQPDLYRDLRLIAQQGKRAKDHFIEANLRLAVSIAKRYRGRGLAFSDLIQFANLGLIRAVEKFDWTKGYKFSTYATWWIRQAVTRGLADEGRTIRLPVHIVDSLNRIRRIQTELLRDLGRKPTNEEIAEEAGLTLEKLEELFGDTRHPVSFNNLIGDKNDKTLEELTRDERIPDPADYLIERTAYNTFQQTLSRALTQQEQFVLKSRFNNNDSFVEIGEALGVTTQAAKIVAARALAKLAHPAFQLGETVSGVIGDETWYADALCRYQYGENFFPVGQGQKIPDGVRALCRRCPVASFCLSYAFDNGIDYGVWGGLSPAERRSAIRQNGRRETQGHS